MLKRCTSFVLAFLLVISCLPVQVFATGATNFVWSGTKIDEDTPSAKTTKVENRVIEIVQKPTMELSWAGLFSEGLCLVEDTNGNILVVNTSGETVLNVSALGYTANYYCTFFNGLCPVQNEDLYWGYINTEGSVVIPFRYPEAGNFSSGFAFAATKDGMVLLSTDGSVSRHFAYDSSEYAYYTTILGKRYWLENDVSEYFTGFRNGLFPVMDAETELWGFVDTSWNIKIPCQYGDLYYETMEYRSELGFFHGYAPVTEGWIDTTGNCYSYAEGHPLDPVFDISKYKPCWEGAFRELFYLGQDIYFCTEISSGKARYISNHDGSFMTEAVYDDIMSAFSDWIGIMPIGRYGFFYSDYAFCKQNGKFGILHLTTSETETETDHTSNTTVTMTRGDNTYNLLREQQSFEQGDGEAATIIVTPDWQGKDIGHIEISQGGKTILKNADGAFVDIVPGDLFSPVESVYAVLVDAEGNIVESLKLKIEITLPAVSRLNASTTETSLTIYENKKGSGNRFDDYQVSSGAKVILNGTTYTTNSKGIVKIPTLTDGSITVEKESYITRTITADQLKESKKIYLQKASDGSPVVSAVWVGTIDVLNQSCAIGLLSKENTTFTAEVDWGSSSYGGIALMQDARTVKFSGTTLTTVLSDNFDVSETIYIVATDAAGNTTKKALNFESGTVSAVPKILDGAEFSISDKISITLPNNIKPDFFAGQKINVGVSSIIPVTVSAEDGKVYVAIGVDLVSYESKDNWASNSSGDTAHVLKKETKTFVDKFKDTGILDASGAASSLKKLKNLEQTYKTAIKYPQGSFGFDANFTVLGFAEGYYDAQGNVTWLDSGVVFNPSVSVSTHLPFNLGPIPMYFEASLSADVQAQLNIIFNKAAKNFTPNGEISGTITLSGGVGFGVKKVMYGAGGVEGKLMPDWHIYDNKQDYFKLSASVNAYAKVGVAFLEFKKNWDPFYNAVWVEYPKANAAAASLMSVSDFYDTANYEVKDLSYLNEGSAFIADGRSGGATLMALVPSAAYLSENLLKTNIYRESTPQFVTFADGTKLAVWLDASNSDINSIVLYYSYFDGTKWSDPAVVYQDGTLDYTPQLVLIGNTAYLTWQNATKVFATTDGLEDIAPYFDVSLAEFIPTAGFVASTITSDGLDMLPTICGTENSVYLVWVKNSQNDWFGNNTANSICYSTYEDGTFGEVVVAYSNLNAIDSLVADHNGSLNIAYCLDTDGDLSTSDDVRLYKNGARVSSAEVSEACPQYVGNTLYWNSNGIVVSEAESETSEVGAVSNYQMVEGNGTKVLVYTESNGLASTLNASYYNEETQMWCEPYALSDGSTFIGAFSAAMSENGVLEVLATSQEVTGTYEDDDPYGEAALTLASLEPYCDLAMGELVYSEDQYSAGDDMEFRFDLTNCGSQTINSATITVSDDQGTVLSSIKMDDVLVPGQTITTSTYFNIDAAATGQNIIITVTPDELTDVNNGDNSQSATLAFEDLSVEQTSWGMQADGTKTLSANIVNYGYAARQNIVVELREGSADGTVIETTTIASLDVLSLDTVSFDLVGQNSEVYFISIKDSGDVFTANDHDYVAIFSDETDCITIDKISADSAQLYLENDQAGRCIVAIYNADGKMLTCGMADVTENAGEISVPYFPFTCDADYTVKVFLVNSSYAPICECVTKAY